MRKILSLTVLIIMFNGCLVSANSSNYVLKDNLALKNHKTFYGDVTEKIEECLTSTKNDSLFVPNELIIKFKDYVIFNNSNNGIGFTGINSIDSLNKEFSVKSADVLFKTTKLLSLSNVYKLVLSENADILFAAEVYSKDPNIEYAEPNYIFHTCTIPNDPYFTYQWALNQGSDHDIDALEAWEITTGNSDVKIAIIDCGVDYTHPDLANNIWQNNGEIPDNGIDDDENGYVDDIKGWNFLDNNNDPMDDYGHGTHCAGIAAAVTNNNIGIAGVAWNCSIMPIKVGNENGIAVSNIAKGITYAADNNADVISMSFGGYKPSNPVKNVIDYSYQKGVVIVAAAGNDNTYKMQYPSAYDHVISVAATENYDEKADFSNYGDWIDIAAPGLDIYSTLPNDTYAIKSGTSMACPHVAGLAALIRSKNKSYSPDIIQNIIILSSDRLSSNYRIGRGRINTYEALIRGPGPATSEITFPIHNDDVKGIINIIGSASGGEFLYYVVEYCRNVIPDKSDWIEIINSTNKFDNDVLCYVDTTLLEEGSHLFRLKVICKTGIYRDTIHVLVNNNHIPFIVDGDDGPDADYIFIQDAINDSGNGDIINVRNGTYYENIRIEKSITLNGEDKNTTIIDGGRKENVVFLCADLVNINSFTIQNCKQEYYHAGIYLKSANYNEIHNNRIIENFYIGPDNFNHHICGVFVDWDSSNNNIYNNNVSKCEEGIVLYGSKPKNNISGNLFSDIEIWNIFLYICNKNQIIGNTIYCSMTSKFYPFCIDLFESNENTICRNKIIGGYRGDGIELRSSNKNVICCNNIINFNENIDGEGGGMGICIFDSNRNKIKNNNFINNEIHAILSDSHFNWWKGNYWDDWIGLKGPFFRIFPKLIKGEVSRLIFSRPRPNFDWHPARNPYEI